MRSSRAAFTLFELILAVALFAVLLTLIGMAINLYLMRVDADRSRVEEAQLARSVLTMIADDIHATSIYKPQDTTALAQLMIASAPFNVDSIDAARSTSSGSSGVGAPTSPTAATKIAALTSSSATSGQSATGSTGSSSSSTSGSSSSSSGTGTDQSDNTLPLGLNGSNADIYVDVTQIPRQEELFSTVTGYTNAQSPVSTGAGGMTSSTSATDGNVIPPADLKTIHYYVRPGNTVEPGSSATTSLAPGAQASTGGLVREEMPRQILLFSEQQGNNDTMGTGGKLIAPEVTQIQFRYFDGSQLADDWDMRQTPQLPVAIEVSVWLKSERAGTSAEDIGSNTLSGTREYKQVVFLPMAALSAANAASATGSSSTSSTDSSSTSNSSDANSGSSGDSVFNSN
jgi:hypothetical protein